MGRLLSACLLLPLVLSGCGDSAEGGDDTAGALDLDRQARCFSIAKQRNGRPAGPAIPARPSADPVEACARLWEQGEVRIGTTAAPPLRACAGRDGQPIVVPNRRRRVCERLGLVDPHYRPPAGRPGFRIGLIDNDDWREVRSHSRRFCSAGRETAAEALEVPNRRKAVLRALARGYPKQTRKAARRGCLAGLRDAR